MMNWIQQQAANVLDLCVTGNSKCVQRYINSRSTCLGDYTLIRGPHNCTISQVFGECRFYDLRKNDVVLDIGAHIGAFSMFISRNVKRVYAVEPLFADILKTNISNNNIDNIEVLDIGLGPEGTLLGCDFMGRTKIIECQSLSKIIKMCGGHIDFLKCDCEGGEWCIKSKELSGIRRMEMEVHSFNGEKLTDFPDMLEQSGFEVTTTNRSDSTMMIHANRPYNQDSIMEV